MPTGWFGIPGDRTGATATKVHFVLSDHRPICGSQLRKGMEFQFCSDGFDPTYVECGRCQRIISDSDARQAYRRHKRSALVGIEDARRRR